MIKATIWTLTPYKNKVIAFVQAKGYTDIEKMVGGFTVRINSKNEDAVLLLTELRHQFPHAYTSGWTEPINE